MITSQMIVAGDSVRQKSGGPTMTVVAVDERYPCTDGTVGGLFCVWEEGMMLYEHVFSPFTLNLVGHAQAGGDERREHQR